MLQGAASATVESMYMLMGNLGDIVDFVKSFIGNTFTNTDSDIFNNLDFGSNKHTTSYSDDAKRKYIEFEQQHFNTNNQAYQAAKCLTYDFNMIEDLGVTITGATISVNGVKLFLTGGAAVITAPETGGTSLIIAIPEIIGGLAITAEGAAVAASGVITISSNFDSYNKTVQCLKDSQMFGENKYEDIWGKGTFNNVTESLKYHFREHGSEVDADNVEQYIRKAEGFARNLKGAKKSYPTEGTPGAIRYTKNGKYIIIGPDKKILSFGLER